MTCLVALGLPQFTNHCSGVKYQVMRITLTRVQVQGTGTTSSSIAYFPLILKYLSKWELVSYSLISMLLLISLSSVFYHWHKNYMYLISIFFLALIVPSLWCSFIADPYKYNALPPLPAQRNLTPPPTLYPQQPMLTPDNYSIPRFALTSSQEISSTRSKRTDINVWWSWFF